MDEFEPLCECKAVSRREFLQIGAGAAAAGIAARGGIATAAPGNFPPSAQTPPPKAWFDALFERGTPPTYEGDALKHVAFPLGGIGTGTIWLHGSGRLINWQIFNNINRSSQVDDSFLAIRTEQDGQPPVVRALQLNPVGPISGVASVRFTGQYPFAYVDFEDPALPVAVRLEAFNPMIPLNDRDSAIPCAIFRLHAINRSGKPVRVSLLASMQNAVGHAAAGTSVGTRHNGYGRNVNQAARTSNRVTVTMHAEPGIPAELDRRLDVVLDHDILTPDDAWPVHNLNVASVGPMPRDSRNPTIYWITRGDLGRMGGGALTALAEAVRGGATLLLSGIDNALLRPVQATTGDETPRKEETYADFEGPNFGQWRAEGAAFAHGPAHGKIGSQQPVSGFLGGGLVNTFWPNDQPQGTLTSPVFTINKPFITFLIGGGNKPGVCCMNLLIDGKVVRTATGKDREQLERHHWDVTDLIGRDARLEIVDRASDGWGHILIDDIRFSTLPSDAITAAEADAWNELLPAEFETVAADAPRKDYSVRLDRSVPALAAVTADRIELATVPGRQPAHLKDGADTLLRFDDGAPAMLTAPAGKGRVFIVPADAAGGADAEHQRDAWLALLAGLMGIRYQPAAGRPSSAPSFGTMCLATPDATATFRASWQDRDVLLADFRDDGRLDETIERDGPTAAGTTLNSALATDAAVPAEGSTEATFVLTWHFPNQYYPQNAWRLGPHEGTLVGNMYANWFHDAGSVATYVLGDIDRLRAETERFRDALYESSLPHYFVDCIGANASILRSPTCFWIKEGTFYGFEGCRPDSGCCPMNCNHVWNYEHTLSKLWPSLERNMRITELVYHQRADGGIHHRVGVPRANTWETIPVADGQCGAVLKAYREHLQSGDGTFLAQQWPRIRRAMDFAIAEWDSDADGIMDKPQFNTYDRVIFGKNTFISSLYLAALRAAERMAAANNDTASAARYRGLYESGREFIATHLFDGEYYIQIADDLTGGYGKGCLADQVVGQWWARVLNLGDILPNEQVQSALKSIYKHAWLTSQEGFEGTQRYLQFATGNDKGLLCAAWPKGGRPDDPIFYRDEVWTGIEYQVAAHKLYEGQLREGLAIVKGARERYAGTKRNPWNEIECGDYYVRAMSSWTLLLAAQGYTYDGPARTLGFDPRLTPENHRSFFSTTSGWGRFEQTRDGRRQVNRLHVAYGRCKLSVLSLGVLAGATKAAARVTNGDHEIPADVTLDNNTATLRFAVPVTVQTDETLTVTLESA